MGKLQNEAIGFGGCEPREQALGANHKQSKI
jgi:hypothetical protein